MHIALCDDSRAELSRLTFLLEEYRLKRDGSLTYDIFTNATDLLETIVAFRAKCKMFSRHLQKPILKTEKGRFKGL